MLRVDNEQDTKDEVYPVRDQSCYTEERRKEEEASLPIWHVIPIIAWVERDDMA